MMELVEWNESYSVGNVLMDAHHRIFFETIKEFSEFPDKNNHEAIKQRIEFLIEYAAMHLGAEEKLMLKANYPGLDGHKAVHDAFVQELLSIKESFDKDSTSITADKILQIMQDWLVTHIVGSDKRYMPYVQKLQV
jgi:hemerythrin-like metal-binding protein